MKKILSLVLALAMTMSLLAGCGGSGDTAADDTSSNSGSVSDTATGDNTVVDGSNQVEVDMTQEPDGIVAGTLVNYVLDKNGTYWRAWDAWMA